MPRRADCGAPAAWRASTARSRARKTERGSVPRRAAAGASPTVAGPDRLRFLGVLSRYAALLAANPKPFIGFIYARIVGRLPTGIIFLAGSPELKQKLSLTIRIKIWPST